MRKLLLLSVLGLTACTSGTMSMDDMIKRVQDTSVAVCSYLPAAASVSQVILATNATLDATLVSIGNGICTAVAQWQQGVQNKSIQTAITPGPVVNGIIIEGKFVNKPQGGQ